jgi:hypothetical protein
MRLPHATLGRRGPLHTQTTQQHGRVDACSWACLGMRWRGWVRSHLRDDRRIGLLCHRNRLLLPSANGWFNLGIHRLLGHEYWLVFRVQGGRSEGESMSCVSVVRF